MESENRTAAEIGIERAGKLCFAAGGFVSEWKRHRPARQILRKSYRVLGGLDFDAGERVILGFGLDDSDGTSIGVEQIIGKACLEWKLPDGYTQTRGDIHFSIVLYDPAALFEQAVNLTA